DLHEPKRVDVVLVPLDDLPVGHCGRFDRHQLIKAPEGQHEPPWVLRGVSRGVDELPGEFERQCQPAIGQVEVEFIGVAFVNAFTAPAPDLTGKPSGYILAKTKSLADFPHGTACAEARDDRCKCRSLSSVGL